MTHLVKAADLIRTWPEEKRTFMYLRVRDKFCPLGIMTVYYCRQLDLPIKQHTVGSGLHLEVADWFGVQIKFQIMVFRLNEHYCFSLLAISKAIVYHRLTGCLDAERIADYLQVLGHTPHEVRKDTKSFSFKNRAAVFNRAGTTTSRLSVINQN